MRWILVFIILYLIPLIVIFKNYNRFNRACIYSGIYVILITTIVISNMYISTFNKIDDNILASIKADCEEVSISTLEDREIDLAKLKSFKRDIDDIEAVAVNSYKECIGNGGVNSISLKALIQLDKEIDKAMYMCERVIEAYEQMYVPELSREEYNSTLEECVACMKEAYEIRYKVVQEADKAVKNKDITRIYNIKRYMKQADEKINLYKIKIYGLEKRITGK